ncbi:MAG: hypothetical protein NTX53_18540 [candidate division WOR-3 bacterium]|nr:hypothetical protein [candidate division WOR-3 bacterium]
MKRAEDALALMWLTIDVMHAFAAGTYSLRGETEHGTALREFAIRECANNHPYLTQVTLVSLWSALECAADDLSVALIRYDPACTSDWPHSERLFPKPRARLSKILSGLDLSRASDEELTVIVKDLRSALSKENNTIVGRFEDALVLAGLDGQLSEEIRRDLVELYQVRNLFAHNAGVVDAEFLRKCPWVQALEGTPLMLKQGDFSRYSGAVTSYSKTLFERIERFAQNPQGTAVQASGAP